MDAGEIRKLSDGANQSGVRAHNERLILSVIQRHGEMPGSDIAKLTGLSAQTVSNILRKLEAELTTFELLKTPLDELLLLILKAQKEDLGASLPGMATVLPPVTDAGSR